MSYSISRHRETVELTKWMFGDAQVERLQRLTKFTQRMSFIKQVLAAEMHEKVLRLLIKEACERNGIEFVPVRGKSFQSVHARSLSVEQGAHASLLMSLLMNTPSSGLTMSKSLLANELMDRMLFSYEQWLRMQSIHDPRDACISFEQFYFIYEHISEGAIDLSACANCGSAYVSVRVNQPLRCPICVTLKVAPYAGRRIGFAELVATDATAANSEASSQACAA